MGTLKNWCEHERRLAEVDRLTRGEHWPSMGQDIMKGRRTEIDLTNGRIVHMGEEVGIRAPANRALTDIVRRVERAELAPDPHTVSPHRRGGPRTAQLYTDCEKKDEGEEHWRGAHEEYSEPAIVGLRDRALIATIVYSFARINAVLEMKVRDYFVQGRRGWVRLHEKGGKEHEVPAITIWKLTSMNISPPPASLTTARVFIPHGGRQDWRTHPKQNVAAG
jgi:hypothetical protein